MTNKSIASRDGSQITTGNKLEFKFIKGFWYDVVKADSIRLARIKLKPKWLPNFLIRFWDKFILSRYIKWKHHQSNHITKKPTNN